MSDGASLEQIHKYQTKHGVPSFNICFVVVRHPQTKRFLAVKETRDRGWYLPAGKVDPGETFQEAAIRETIEEAGIRVRLTGILSIQFAPQPTCIRMRVVYLAEPIDDTPPKSIPDYESDEARWVTLEEMEELGRSPPGLRGYVLLEWGRYVEQGGVVYPLSVLSCREA